MYSYIIAWKISPSIILDNSRKRKRIYTRGEEIVNNRSREIPREGERNTIRFCIRFCRGLNCGDKLEEKSWNTSRATNWRLAMKLNVESCVYRALTDLPPQRMDPFSLVTPLLVSRDSWYGGRKKSIFATRYQVWSVARVARRIFPGCLRNISRG